MSEANILLQPVRDLFERAVVDVPSTDDLFNPYRDEDPALDRPGAAATRRENLWRYLGAYDRLPDLVLVAEAPGPRGTRFSGVPFVSEAQLQDPAFPISGERTGLDDVAQRETSAMVVWRTLGAFWPRFFIWNSVPFHPHRKGEPLTIRAPRVREVRRHAPTLMALHQLLQPQRVVAVGRKAERALAMAEVPCTYVRHPSQGGIRKFERGIAEVVQALGA